LCGGASTLSERSAVLTRSSALCDAVRTRDGHHPRPPPAPLLPCSDVKKLIVLLAVLGIAVLAAKKIRST
jgi:hypothetical protein